MGQSHLADLLRQIVGMAANARAMRNTAANKDRRIARAVTCAAGAFLADVLLGRAVHFTTRLDLVRTGLTASELPANGTLQDIVANIVNAEDRIVDRDIAGSLASQGFDCEFHYSASLRSFARRSLSTWARGSPPASIS